LVNDPEFEDSIPARKISSRKKIKVVKKYCEELTFLGYFITTCVEIMALEHFKPNFYSPQS